MTVKRIYICRHGYRMNWLPEPHPPNPTGIDSDPPLAPHGIEQAEELARHLERLPADQRPQFILSSPFYRCVETAQPITKSLGSKVALERGVGEYYRVGRNVIPEPANYDRLEGFFPEVLVKENEWPRDTAVGVIPSLEGESPEAIFDRCQRFWRLFFPVFEAKHPEVENVLIVTHAATAIALGMSLIGKSSVLESIDDTPNNFIRAGACSMSTYVKEGDHWKLTVNGDTSFLREGEEMNWNFHSGFEAGSDEDIKSRKKQEEETEDFYVVVEVPNFGRRFHEEADDDQGLGKSHLIKPSSYFQITELNHATPLFKISNNYTKPVGKSLDSSKGVDVASKIIDGKIYSTEWTELVGTDMIFDDEGELLAISRDHLQVDEQISLEVVKERPEAENDERPTRGVLEEQPRSSFLRKAIKQSKSSKHRAASARATLSPAVDSQRSGSEPVEENGNGAGDDGKESADGTDNAAEANNAAADATNNHAADETNNNAGDGENNDAMDVDG